MRFIRSLNLQRSFLYIIIIGLQLQMEQTGSLKDFEMMKKLGEGAFGQVYMVKRKRDGQTYAMKKVKLISLKDKEK